MLFVNAKQVAEGHIPKTVPFIFSEDEGTFDWMPKPRCQMTTSKRTISSPERS